MLILTKKFHLFTLILVICSTVLVSSCFFIKYRSLNHVTGFDLAASVQCVQTSSGTSAPFSYLCHQSGRHFYVTGLSSALPSSSLLVRFNHFFHPLSAFAANTELIDFSNLTAPGVQTIMDDINASLLDSNVFKFKLSLIYQMIVTNNLQITTLNAINPSTQNAFNQLLALIGLQGFSTDKNLQAALYLYITPNEQKVGNLSLSDLTNTLSTKKIPEAINLDFSSVVQKIKDGKVAIYADDAKVLIATLDDSNSGNKKTTVQVCTTNGSCTNQEIDHQLGDSVNKISFNASGSLTKFDANNNTVSSTFDQFSSSTSNIVGLNLKINDKNINENKIYYTTNYDPNSMIINSSFVNTEFTCSGFNSNHEFVIDTCSNLGFSIPTALIYWCNVNTDANKCDLNTGAFTKITATTYIALDSASQKIIQIDPTSNGVFNFQYFTGTTSTIITTNGGIRIKVTYNDPNAVTHFFDFLPIASRNNELEQVYLRNTSFVLKSALAVDGFIPLSSSRSVTGRKLILTCRDKNFALIPDTDCVFNSNETYQVQVRNCRKITSGNSIGTACADFQNISTDINNPTVSIINVPNSADQSNGDKLSSLVVKELNNTLSVYVYRQPMLLSNLEVFATNDIADKYLEIKVTAKNKSSTLAIVNRLTNESIPSVALASFEVEGKTLTNTPVTAGEGINRDDSTQWTNNSATQWDSIPDQVFFKNVNGTIQMSGSIKLSSDIKKGLENQLELRTTTNSTGINLTYNNLTDRYEYVIPDSIYNTIPSTNIAYKPNLDLPDLNANLTIPQKRIDLKLYTKTGIEIIQFGTLTYMEPICGITDDGPVTSANINSIILNKKWLSCQKIACDMGYKTGANDCSSVNVDISTDNDPKLVGLLWDTQFTKVPSPSDKLAYLFSYKCGNERCLLTDTFTNRPIIGEGFYDANGITKSMKNNNTSSNEKFYISPTALDSVNARIKKSTSADNEPTALDSLHDLSFYYRIPFNPYMQGTNELPLNSFSETGIPICNDLSTNYKNGNISKYGYPLFQMQFSTPNTSDQSEWADNIVNIPKAVLPSPYFNIPTSSKIPKFYANRANLIIYPKSYWSSIINSTGSDILAYGYSVFRHDNDYYMPEGFITDSFRDVRCVSEHTPYPKKIQSVAGIKLASFQIPNGTDETANWQNNPATNWNYIPDKIEFVKNSLGNVTMTGHLQIVDSANTSIQFNNGDKIGNIAVRNKNTQKLYKLMYNNNAFEFSIDGAEFINNPVNYQFSNDLLNSSFMNSSLIPIDKKTMTLELVENSSNNPTWTVIPNFFGSSQNFKTYTMPICGITTMVATDSLTLDLNNRESDCSALKTAAGYLTNTIPTNWKFIGANWGKRFDDNRVAGIGENRLQSSDQIQYIFSYFDSISGKTYILSDTVAKSINFYEANGLTLGMAQNPTLSALQSRIIKTNGNKTISSALSAVTDITMDPNSSYSPTGIPVCSNLTNSNSLPSLGYPLFRLNMKAPNHVDVHTLYLTNSGYTTGITGGLWNNGTPFIPRTQFNGYDYFWTTAVLAQAPNYGWFGSSSLTNILTTSSTNFTARCVSIEN